MKGIWLTITLAMKALRANPLQSALSMLGIVIGVCSVILILSVGAGAESLITGTIQKVGTKKVSVQAGAANETGPPAAAQGIIIKTLDLDDADALRELPHVAGVSPEIQATGEAQTRSKQGGVTYVGVGADFAVVDEMTVARGRFFSADEDRSMKRVMVLGQTIAEDFFPRQNPVGQTMKVNDQPFTVVGVLASKGAQIFGSPDDRLYIPVRTAQRRMLNVRYVQSINLVVDDEVFLQSTKQRVEGVMRRENNIKDGEDDDFSVRLVATALDLVSGITGAVRAFLALIASVSLVVGGIGIMNILLMSVSQRTREIGLRKAIGARPSMIRGQFLIESLVLTISGGIIGIVTGILFSWLIALLARSQGYEWVFSVDPFAIVLGVTVSVVVGVIFGLKPANKAAALDPINALRYE